MLEEKKSILHINSNYLTSRLHENLIDGLSFYGFDNTIYMPMKKEMQKEILYQSKHKVDNSVVFKNYHKYFFSFKQEKIYNYLKQKFDISTFEMVHAHTLFTDGNIAYTLKMQYGIPYVVTVRGTTDLNFFKKRPNLRKRGREILQNASKIIFLSNSSKEILVNNYLDSIKSEIIKKMEVIPNGIDDFWFENKGQPKHLPNKKDIKFLFVGRIIKSKNIPLIIKALNKLKYETSINPVLSIVGEDIDSKLAKKIKTLNKFEMNWLGKASKESLLNIYREHDVYIMPSYPETFGLVYVEAMSQGLPIIYSEGAGFDKQFKDGDAGYAVNPNDTQDIVNKILLIIDNYDCISQRNIELYKIFNWNSITSKYIEIYSEILGD